MSARRPWWWHVIGTTSLAMWALWTVVTVLCVLPVQLLVLPWDRNRHTTAAIARWTWGRLHFAAQPFWRLWRTGLERTAGGPYVIAANHQSLLDIPLLMTLPLPMRMVARPGVGRMPVYGQMARFGGHVFLDEAAPEAALAECRALLAKGISIVVFPEGTRTEDGTLGPFARGAVQIALDAGVPLLPVCIAGTRTALPKGGFYPLAPIAPIHLQVLAPWRPEGARRTAGHRIRAEIGAALDGPRPWTVIDAVEARYAPQGRWRGGWARGKTTWDPIFWALLDRLPIEGRIVDLGCGEGLVGAYLGAAGRAVEVVGFDVDAGRVAVAKAAGLDARVGDARTVELPECDAIVCIDVLHYLSPPEQAAVVGRMCAALRPGGCLFVRDPEVGRGAASWWTQTAERIFVATGRHAGEGVQVGGGAVLAALLGAELEDVRIEDASAGTPFANVLVWGRKGLEPS